MFKIATLSIRRFLVSLFLIESFTLLRRLVGREKVLYISVGLRFWWRLRRHRPVHVYIEFGNILKVNNFSKELSLCSQGVRLQSRYRVSKIDVALHGPANRFGEIWGPHPVSEHYHATSTPIFRVSNPAYLDPYSSRFRLCSPEVVVRAPRAREEDVS